MKKMVSILGGALLLASLLCLCPVVGNGASSEGGVPCPWAIHGIRVGKWANGNQKAFIWIEGFFPIPPGVAERPRWSVNGTDVGHSTILINQQALPNSSHLLRAGDNVITVTFSKPPYDGASNTKVILDFNWDRVSPGGYMVYR